MDNNGEGFINASQHERYHNFFFAQMPCWGQVNANSKCTPVLQGFFWIMPFSCSAKPSIKKWPK
jgi:hypothetical protein